ncbi:hypothetical protein F5887DRAFT_1059966 [Amanita rubescens]|nr:hypothetical protein F5887DRAFT_1059966 [Amanita rubescens]
MGVKSLWSLLAPVGRPILLETVEGKAMAIDSSIWIYQFQATMRDKDGRVLINAHVLGFLRRITKLLFYGIKPVFVFDGGAPALKRNTLAERKRRKAGAVTSHAKIAEKLLAARMRKDALERAKGSSNKGKEKEKEKVDVDKIVYLEDIDPTMPKAPPRKNIADSTTTTPSGSPAKKKSKFYDHDPYRLPDVDLEAAVAQATRSAMPDPRLATEEELRTFIEEMRPEDFDINSPDFRQLPTEIQYEIIGDLRLKSRQTSHARLEKMLRKSRTPMDFSKAQIQNLRQRNALTQQLLTTTDSIGKAHISIPVRIASERNKEYVLVKNEGEEGGWILGIRDHGTQEKPIVIDQDDEYASNDEDMEEVTFPTDGSMDGDLRQFQSEMALQAIANRNTSKGLAPLKTRSYDEDDGIYTLPHAEDPDSENEALSIAIQASLDDARPKSGTEVKETTGEAIAPDSTEINPAHGITGNLFASPSRLETVLSFANINPSSSKMNNRTTLFGKPSLLSKDASTAVEPDNTLEDAYIDSDIEQNIDEPVTQDVIITIDAVADGDLQMSSLIGSDSDEDMEEVIPELTAQQVVNETLECIARNTARSRPVTYAIPSTPEIHTTLLVLDEIQDAGSNQDVPLGEEHDNDDPIHWSRSPSPTGEVNGEASNQVVEQSWDAAEEMDPHAEESEFARFMSQVKGRDLEDVRREIDDEIETLNQQRKAAMRNAEDITQQMVAQIMVTPMEAEAQCAELVSLGLVDGVITDDSDVFLFGAHCVFKNMFNQSKTVEAFLLSDLSRELGLDRDTLIRLAYLLGSDYVEGLPGVGPVVAMELLKEFPGMDGLHKFKDWWLRVQSGRDTAEETQSKFKKRFKKKFKNLYLDKDWPNSAGGRDAYYHPAVDGSEEQFKWGLPDLDGLRQFFQQELGWQQTKVDELLLPIIQKMNKRGQAAAMNKQSNLTEFFDVSAGMGAFVPKKRQAYTSKRLQNVVADFRKQQKSSSSTIASQHESEGSANEYNESTSRKRRKTAQGGRKRKSKTNAAAVGGKRPRGKGRKQKTPTESEDESPERSGVEDDDANVTPLAAQLRPRPRPANKSAKPGANEMNSEGDDSD